MTHTVSPEGRAKLRAAWTPDRKARVAAKLTGPLGPNWAGDDVGYTGAHFRARALLAGRPCQQEDETCKGPVEAALNHAAPADHLRTPPEGTRYAGHVYSPDPEDYMPLCRSHHMRYDGHRRAR
jgi:hypothetical protein